MARCSRCEKRIGWLKRAVEGRYCSAACRDASLVDAMEQEHALRDERFSLSLSLDSEERTRVRLKLELEAAVLRAKSEIARREAAAHVPCPKCGASWRTLRGGGAQGRDRGECDECGFGAVFLAVEQCPNCRCDSLVVESEDDARCPRCKSRPRRRRQIA